MIEGTLFCPTPQTDCARIWAGSVGGGVVGRVIGGSVVGCVVGVGGCVVGVGVGVVGGGGLLPKTRSIRKGLLI